MNHSGFPTKAPPKECFLNPSNSINLLLFHFLHSFHPPMIQLILKHHCRLVVYDVGWEYLYWDILHSPLQQYLHCNYSLPKTNRGKGLRSHQFAQTWLLNRAWNNILEVEMSLAGIDRYFKTNPGRKGREEAQRIDQSASINMLIYNNTLDLEIPTRTVQIFKKQGKGPVDIANFQKPWEIWHLHTDERRNRFCPVTLFIQPNTHSLALLDPENTNKNRPLPDLQRNYSYTHVTCPPRFQSDQNKRTKKEHGRTSRRKSTTSSMFD